ncbi:MAG: hypothetical protein HY238_24265, partial [Acidobacteria bacterium]|nr:hypothetical protein [Acidobacteriota bacterium]
MTRSRKTLLLDSLAIFFLMAALVRPLFQMKYQNRWASIESTFISDVRFLRDHWPHPRWQPLWYGGTRFDYVYPPALRYGPAVLTKIYPALIPAKAYHIYTAFFYCLGIAGVYVFVRTASGSRRGAWLTAVAAALLSPSFLFVTEWREDAQMLTPMRWGALVRYGEGPHMTALAWLPFALATAWRALPGRRPAALAASAVCSALVVSNNFYGGTALALLFPILAWSLWVTQRDHRIWLRAVAIAALAYGLTAFWLAPSYFRITTANLQFVSEPGNRWSLWVALAAVAVFAAVSERWARGRAEVAYQIFVWGAFGFLTLHVLGNYFFKFRVMGEPGRLGPELDLAMILLAVEGLRRLWARGRFLRLSVVVLVLLSFLPIRQYLRHPWRVYERDWEFQDRIEYQLTSWMARYLPDARTLATGSVRFWYNAWYDLAQIGGGSEQGLLNPAAELAQRQILASENTPASIQWLLALGVDAAIVHEK